MAKQNKKTKKRNSPKRKDPLFAKIVMTVARDSLVTMEEFMAHKKEIDPDSKPEHDEAGRLIVKGMERPPGTTVVEGLNGNLCYNDLRLARHIDVIHKIMLEFGDEFWQSKELEKVGSSIMDLRRDKKGRVWADDLTITHFVYLCIAMELAEWSYPRSSWASLDEGMPYILFTCPKTDDELQGDHDDTTAERSTAEEHPAAQESTQR